MSRRYGHTTGSTAGPREKGISGVGGEPQDAAPRPHAECPSRKGSGRQGIGPPVDFRSNGHARLLKMNLQSWWRMLSQLRTIEVYAAQVGFCQVRIAPAQFSASSSDLDYRGFRMLWIRCALDARKGWAAISETLSHA